MSEQNTFLQGFGLISKLALNCLLWAAVRIVRGRFGPLGGHCNDNKACVIKTIAIAITIFIVTTIMIILVVLIIIFLIVMVTQHIPTMTKSHHGGELSVMMKVGMCQCQKPTIHHTPCDELYFGVYM